MDKVGLPNSPSSEQYKYHITMPDGSTRKVLSTSASGNYVKSVYHQRYMDVISVGNGNGTSTTFYADTQWISNAADRVVFRSYGYAYASGGVSFAVANNDASNAGADIGCRLAFRGTIVMADSVTAFKALKTEADE